MLKRLFITALVIFTAVFTGVFLSGLPQEDSTALLPQSRVEKSSSQVAPRTYPEDSSPAGSSEALPGYFLMDYRGRVAVMASDGQTPEMVFDIFTKTLPEADQKLLAGGIYVDTYEELARLVEDYIS